MRGRHGLFIIIWLNVILVGQAYCAEKKSLTALPSSVVPISAHAEATKGSITIGEVIECKLTVRYKKDVEILGGISETEAAGLEIKNTKEWEDKDGAFRILGKTIFLTAYQLGEFMLEPVEISYRIKSGPVQTIKTNPLYISVESVASGEKKTDIRDVKGVVKLPYLFLKYLLPLGIPILLGSLLAFYFFYIRKREIERISRTVKLSPAEEALQNLHELFDSTLLRDGKIKAYYLRFSEIFKVFLERQFGIQSVEATTSEISRLIRKIPVADDLKMNLIEILEAADFAKFAKWVPSPTDINTLNKRAEALITAISDQSFQTQNSTSHAVS